MKNRNSSYQKQLEQICQEVNEYVMNRFKYKIPPAYITSGTNIFMPPQAQISIYLRFFHEQVYKLWPPKTIIIAQLGFKKARKGNGTHFLSFLKDIAMKYDYDYIGLESTNDNSSAFAEHFNFKDLGDKWNYLISIKELHIP
jgi:hypothetical protein